MPAVVIQFTGSALPPVFASVGRRGRHVLRVHLSPYTDRDPRPTPERRPLLRPSAPLCRFRAIRAPTEGRASLRRFSTGV